MARLGRGLPASPQFLRGSVAASVAVAAVRVQAIAAVPTPAVTTTLGAIATPARINALVGVPIASVSITSPTAPGPQRINALARVPTPGVITNVVVPTSVDPEAVWVHSLPALSSHRPGSVATPGGGGEPVPAGWGADPWGDAWGS